MKRSILFLVLTVAGACSSSETTRPVDAAPGEDAAIDTTTQDMDVPDAAGDADALDLAMDGAPDVRIDFTVDAAADRGMDAAVDGGVDADFDSAVDASARDAGVDGALDLGVDGALDARVDGAPDASFDAPSCVGVVCESAPANNCADAVTVRRFTTPGECLDGRCVYAEIDTPCADEVAPEPECSGPLSRSIREFESTGRCAFRRCEVRETERLCPFGCEAGACREACSTVWDEPSSVDSSVVGGSAPSLAAEGLDVAYARPLREIRYAEQRRAGAWSATSVSEASRADSGVAMDVDPRTGSHVVFVSNARELAYAHRAPDSDGWTTSVIEGREVCSFSLVLDSMGTPHVAYSVSVPIVGPVGGTEVWFGVLGSTGWALEPVAPVGRTAGCVALDLALGPGDHPHVVFESRVGGAFIVHAEFDAGVWPLTTVANAAGIGDVQADVDPVGDVHALFLNDDESLQYARRMGDAGSWLETTITPFGALDATMAVDRFGRPHIVYVDETRLRYVFINDEGTALPSLLAVERFAGDSFRQPRLRAVEDTLLLAYVRTLGGRLFAQVGALCPAD